MPEEGALEGLLPGDQQEAGGSQRGFPRPGGPHRGPGLAGAWRRTVLLGWLSPMTSFTRSPPHCLFAPRTLTRRLYVTLVCVCVFSVPRRMSVKADTLPFSGLGPGGSRAQEAALSSYLLKGRLPWLHTLRAGAQGKSAGNPAGEARPQGARPGARRVNGPKCPLRFLSSQPSGLCALSGQGPAFPPSLPAQQGPETLSGNEGARETQPWRQAATTAMWAPGATALWLLKAHTACPERRGVHTAQDSPPGTPLLCFVI